MLALWRKIGLRLYSLGSAGVENLRNFDFGSGESGQLYLLLGSLVLAIAVFCLFSRHADLDAFDAWFGVTASRRLFDPTPKTLLVGIDNPFALSLPPPSSAASSFSSGVSLLRSSRSSAVLCLSWGLEIDALYQRFDSLSWRSFLSHLAEGRLFEGEALETDTRFVDPCLEEPFIAHSSITSAALGPRWPRTRYPLVAVLGLDWNAAEKEEIRDFDGSSPQRVVALVTVFHVQDADDDGGRRTAAPTSPNTEKERMETHAMLTFVVTNADQKLRLQPYIPSGSPPEEEEETPDRSTSFVKAEIGSNQRQNSMEVEKTELESHQCLNDVPAIPNSADSGILDATAESTSETASRSDAAEGNNRHERSTLMDSTSSATYASPKSHESSPTSPSFPRRSEDCSVCLSLPVTVVTLPCRHAALCPPCLERLRDRRCPVCRGVIQTHFELDVAYNVIS